MHECRSELNCPVACSCTPSAHTWPRMTGWHCPMAAAFPQEKLSVFPAKDSWVHMQNWESTDHIKMNFVKHTYTHKVDKGRLTFSTFSHQGIFTSGIFPSLKAVHTSLKWSVISVPCLFRHARESDSHARKVTHCLPVNVFLAGCAFHACFQMIGKK